MNITICDICNNRIRINGHKATFTKCNAIYNDVEKNYDVCDDCFNRLVNLWDKNRASVTVHIDK